MGIHIVSIFTKSRTSVAPCVMSAPQVDIFSLAAYGEIDSLRHLLAEDPRLLHTVDCYGSWLMACATALTATRLSL